MRIRIEQWSAARDGGIDGSSGYGEELHGGRGDDNDDDSVYEE